jgi:addiction module RelE/StbE family toxin
VKLRWSPEAEAELLAIHDYIAADNPTAADPIERGLHEAADSLSTFPHKGRIGRWEGTRELVLTGSPYLIVYQLRSDAIYIVRVVHGHQLWPPEDAP